MIDGDGRITSVLLDLIVRDRRCEGAKFPRDPSIPRWSSHECTSRFYGFADSEDIKFCIEEVGVYDRGIKGARRIQRDVPTCGKESCFSVLRQKIRLTHAKLGTPQQ